MKIVYTSDLHKGYNERTHKLHTKFYQQVAAEKPDLYLIIGDLGAARFEHFESALAMAREYLDCEIVITRGNHDLWDKVYTIGDIYNWSPPLYAKYNIIDINVNKIFRKENLVLLGWQGWYGVSELDSNDMNFVRLNRGDNCLTFNDCHRFLQHAAHCDFDKMLLMLDEVQKERDKSKIAVMSHMPIFVHNPSDEENIDRDGPHSYWQFLVGKTDYFLYGHTHQFCNRVVDGIHCLNSGSDYNKPKYAILEL